MRISVPVGTPLPAVCVHDGEPAVTTIEQKVGGLHRGWWILVFFGPLGWFGLLLVTGRGSQPISVALPVCSRTDLHWRLRRRQRWLAVGALLLAEIGLFATRGAAAAWVLCGLAVGVVLLAHWRWGRETVALTLDPDRTRVTLVGVAPAFADALR